MESRKICLLSKNIGDLLVKQLAHELKNYNLYKTFANFFSIEAILPLEEYYNKRADEELLHHKWIFDYLSEADYKFTYPVIETNTEKFENIIDPFKLTVDREILTTQMIYSIYNEAVKEGDVMTISWLLKHLIPEQIEEENTSRMASTIMYTESNIYMKAKQVLNLLDK